MLPSPDAGFQSRSTSKLSLKALWQYIKMWVRQEIVDDDPWDGQESGLTLEPSQDVAAKRVELEAWYQMVLCAHYLNDEQAIQEHLPEPPNEQN